MVWIGDFAAEHKLAPAWQPLLAWLDELAGGRDLDLDLDPEGGAALQAAALAAMDAQAGSGGHTGFARSRAGSLAGTAGNGRGVGLPVGLRGLAERAAGAAGREAVAEIVAIFPVMLPATAKEARGAPIAHLIAAVTAKGGAALWQAQAAVYMQL